MDYTFFDVQADFLKAMGHPVRLQILQALRDGQMCVGDLVRRMEMSQSMISRQLHILRYAGIVTCERHGLEMVYRLADEKINIVCDTMQKVLTDRFQKHSEIASANGNTLRLDPMRERAK